MPIKTTDQQVGLALSGISGLGSRKRFITISNWHKYLLPQDLEKIKQEYITEEHKYLGFGNFLVEKYNFHPKQVYKGEFNKVFGSFKEISELRRRYLIGKIEEDEEIQKELKEVNQEITELKAREELSDGNNSESERQLIVEEKNNSQKSKAREAKKKLLETIYLLVKNIEERVKTKRKPQFEMFLIQNVKSIKEILEILTAIEKEGDFNKKTTETSVMPKFFLTRNEITTHSLNFQTINPEDLVTFNSSSENQDSKKESQPTKEIEKQ